MKKLALFCLLALSMVACKKDKFAPPEVQTLSITANSPTSITFKGNIVSVGNQTIKDYGFIYSVGSSSIDEKNGTKVSMGAAASEGEFNKTLDSFSYASAYGNTIYARAYITDQNGTVLGTVLSATLPRPNATGISPTSGKVGETINFMGKFYNPSPSNVIVTFQNVPAKVISASDTQISVEIPKGMSAVHGQSVSVNLSISGVTVVNSTYFTILANITDFTPKSGPVGTTVSLLGDNLPNNNYYGSAIPIYVGDILLNTNNYSSQVVIPFTAAATNKLYTQINGQKVALPGEFTVVAPQITSINPEEVIQGQYITIYGSNFATRYDTSNGRPMIKLGSNAYVDAGSGNATNFNYSIPTNMASGDYTVTYKVGPHEVQAPKKITVLSVGIKSFSPTSGAPGREVNITGNFVQGSGYTVAFGNVNVYGTATSSTNLRVIVPTGINPGKVKITFDPSNRQIVAPGDFEILGPTFTSFAPASGVAGTLVTIRGTGFSPNTFNTSVRFGTIAVTPISVTETTIVVAVPSNVAPGAMKLSVVSSGQTVVHNDNFTITN